MAYEKRYKVGKFGGSKYMTAKDIFDKVQENLEDNQLISNEAEELVKVCEEREFPKCYEKKIKICILDSFTNQKAEDYLDDKLEITSICYNSLSSSKKEESEARQRYLLAFIKAIPLRKRRSVSSYPEKMYNKLSKKWGKEKFVCYKAFKKLDFARVKKSLEFDFEITLIQAEKRGFFSKSLHNTEGED